MSEIIYCSECGSENVYGAKFCSNCGCVLQYEAMPPQEITPVFYHQPAVPEIKNKKNTGIIVGVIIAVLLISIAAGVIGALSRNKDPEITVPKEISALSSTAVQVSKEELCDKMIDVIYSTFGASDAFYEQDGGIIYFYITKDGLNSMSLAAYEGGPSLRSKWMEVSNSFCNICTVIKSGFKQTGYSEDILLVFLNDENPDEYIYATYDGNVWYDYVTGVDKFDE